MANIKVFSSYNLVKLHKPLAICMVYSKDKLPRSKTFEFGY